MVRGDVAAVRCWCHMRLSVTGFTWLLLVEVTLAVSNIAYSADD